jgi:hypothetical protein
MHNNKEARVAHPFAFFAKGWVAVRSHIEKFFYVYTEEAQIGQSQPSTRK